MHDYSQKARIYWWIMALTGFGLLAFALGRLASQPSTTLMQVVLICVFVCAGAFFPVRMPGATQSFAAGDIYIFLALLVIGVEAAAVVAAVEGAVGALRTSKRWTSWFGTPAAAAIATTLSGFALLTAQGMLQTNGKLSGATTLLTLTAFAMLYFALCNLLPSLLMALKRNERLDVGAVLKDRSWMALAHLCSIAMASLLHLGGAKVDGWLLLSALPVILISQWVAHNTLERVAVESQV